MRLFPDFWARREHRQPAEDTATRQLRFPWNWEHSRWRLIEVRRFVTKSTCARVLGVRQTSLVVCGVVSRSDVEDGTEWRQSGAGCDGRAALLHSAAPHRMFACSPQLYVAATDYTSSCLFALDISGEYALVGSRSFSSGGWILPPGAAESCSATSLAMVPTGPL